MSDRVLDKVTSAVVLDSTGQQNANLGSTVLTSFNIYQGEVMFVDYLTKRLTVRVNNQILENCIYAANSIAALLGFASTALPPAGSIVVCLYTTQITWVIGTQPRKVRDIYKYDGDIAGPSEYSHIGDKAFASKHDDTSVIRPGLPQSRDVLPGEEELTNDMGIALRLLTNFAQLDSGGLAKVECHLLNDMVRIVDNYYAHHHCGGDTMIWSNGRNNYEDHFTQYPHEAAGKLNEDDPYAEVFEPLSQHDVYKLPEGASEINSAGRWRKSTYIGFLGDMLHFWITHPVQVISNYAQESARASRFKTWVGSDGTLMIQAAGDIVIDVTQHMVIPEIHNKWDDPNLDTEKMMQQLDIEYLKIWGTGKTRWDDLKVACWQMRNYLKYITVWHSLSRFRQLSKGEKPYCTIKPESENPVGDANCDEKDKLQANGKIEGTASAAGTCTLHMCPDGSITLLSGNSTSCIMNNGNMQLVAPFNIEIKAGDMFSVTARDISMKAFRNFEIVSLAGAIYQKARQAIKTLCERGRIWIKCDSSDTNQETDPEIPEVPSEYRGNSIVIDAPEGRVLMHGEKEVTIGSGGGKEKGIVTVQVKDGIIKMLANKGSIILQCFNYVLNTVQSLIYSVSTTVIGTVWSMFNKFTFTAAGTFECDAIQRVKMLMSPNRLFARMFQSEDTEKVFPTKEEYRAETLENAIPRPVQSDADALKGHYAYDVLKNNYRVTEFKNGKEKWKFFKWQINNNNVLSANSLKADPWTDTFINCREKLASSWIDSYVQYDWNNPEHLMKRGTRTEKVTMPWPGIGAQCFIFQSGEAIPVGEKWEKDFEAKDIKGLQDMTPIPFTYYFSKTGEKPEEKNEK